MTLQIVQRNKTEQVSVELCPSALIVMHWLLSTAAAGTWCWHPQLLIDISCPQGVKQQTCQLLLQPTDNTDNKNN